MTDYWPLLVGVYKNMDYMLHVRMRILLRWLEIVYWRARPVPLNTATESRPMHAAFKLNMLRVRAHQARACTNNDLVPLKSGKFRFRSKISLKVDVFDGENF